MKPSTLVDRDATIMVDPEDRAWVSRGAYKLLAALDRFPIDPTGKRAADVGASTGGFTEVLLDKGVAEVVTIDVGEAQLSPRLRRLPEVTAHERTDVREVSAEELGGCFDLVVADLSFISLTKVTGNLAELACPGADLICLLKPQFEVDRRSLGKGGILRDPEMRSQAVVRVIDAFRRSGLGTLGLIRSPIKGGDGNAEFLLWCRKGSMSIDLEVPI